jgi:hypothetical protein
MLVVGYVMGIRSERRLWQDVHLNLAYRWFCRLGLDDKVPDHSTFSRYRHGGRARPPVRMYAIFRFWTSADTSFRIAAKASASDAGPSHPNSSARVEAPPALVPFGNWWCMGSCMIMVSSFGELRP